MSWRPGMPGGYRTPNSVYALLWLAVLIPAAIIVLSAIGWLIPEIGALFRVIGGLGTWDEAALLLPGLAGRRLPRFVSPLRAVLGFLPRRKRGSLPSRPRFDMRTDLEFDSYSNVVTVKRRVERPGLLEPNVQYLVNDYGLTAVGQP
ncbi:MAG: hypothetical protein QNJ92_06730 [Alphaproteobacteria bacterium]|nr:hypothetical protein [Alphaproteobacteria bacterium]